MQPGALTLHSLCDFYEVVANDFRVIPEPPRLKDVRSSVIKRVFELPSIPVVDGVSLETAPWSLRDQFCHVSLSRLTFARALRISQGHFGIVGSLPTRVSLGNRSVSLYRDHGLRIHGVPNKVGHSEVLSDIAGTSGAFLVNLKYFE